MGIFFQKYFENFENYLYRNSLKTKHASHVVFVTRDELLASPKLIYPSDSSIRFYIFDNEKEKDTKRHFSNLKSLGNFCSFTLKKILLKNIFRLFLMILRNNFTMGG